MNIIFLVSPVHSSKAGSVLSLDSVAGCDAKGCLCCLHILDKVAAGHVSEHTVGVGGEGKGPENLGGSYQRGSALEL